MTSASTCCFGKVPDRGDFVKVGDNHQLIGLLDRWVSEAMNLLSEDPNWKASYDNAAPLDFLFVGARSRMSIIGHLMPSKDQSGRRYPLMTAGVVERDDSLVFRCGPVGLANSFGALAHVGRSCMTAFDAARLANAMQEIDCARDFATTLETDPLGTFVRQHTLEGVAQLLGVNGSHGVRKIILAIGLLLRPMLGRSHVEIDKDLILPLPTLPQYRYVAAATWLYLLTAFLRGTAAELEVILVHTAESPKLLVSFNGSASRTLVSAIAPNATRESQVALLDPDWVDTHPAVTDDYGVAKLSSYLKQDGICLEQAFATFREVFLGE